MQKKKTAIITARMTPEDKQKIFLSENKAPAHAIQCRVLCSGVPHVDCFGLSVSVQNWSLSRRSIRSRHIRHGGPCSAV